jgi:hypothetical protein
MINRRVMIAGGALALAGSAWPLRSGQSADKSFLPQGLPEGVYDTAMLEALPGKKPLIKLSYLRRITRRHCLISRRNSRRTIPSSCAITSPAFRKRSTPRSGA